MKKIIYIYSDSVPNQYKIGKADQRTNQEEDITIDEIGNVRISEQLSAATRGDIVIHATLDISHYEGDSKKVENYIHKNLEKLGNITRLKRTVYSAKFKEKLKEGTTEWFETNLSAPEIIDMVDKLIIKFTNKTGKIKYEARAYQAYIKALVLDQVEAGNPVIAAELAPRFGKTLWSLDLFNALCDEFGYQYLILPAYVLTAHSSFMNDFKAFSDFNDIKFVSDKDSDFEDQIRNNKESRMIIAVSLHTSTEAISKYNCLAEIETFKKVSIIDEADFGAHTKSSKNIINYINSGLKILITGTAIERAIAGYDINDVIRWSYTDMLLLQDNNHPILENFLK
jgi:hypothetical protein